MIDVVYVINLDRRPDRWSSFLEKLPAPWPFPKPERISAVDGKALGIAPPWFKQGVPAWATACSHIQTIERFLHSPHKTCLILEDDALFGPNWFETFSSAWKNLPNDWWQFYIGGQHLGAPVATRNLPLVRITNVNRLHAYCLSKAGARETYRMVTDYLDWSKHPRHHIDHRMGLVHQASRKCYGLKDWIVGQDEGESDILCRRVNVRFWKGVQLQTSEPTDVSILPAVVVMGPPSHGTSLTTSVLHSLGLEPGNDLFRIEEKCTYEDNSLRALVFELAGDQNFKTDFDVDEFVRRLSNWGFQLRLKAMANGKPGICLKLPHLCRADLLPLVGRSLAPCTMVRVTRDEESVKSSVSRRPWLKNMYSSGVFDAMNKALDELLPKGSPVVDFGRLLASPESEIRKLCESLNLTSDERAIQNLCRKLQKEARMRSGT